MKKIIILEHNGGQLANQLWLFVSVYAYCLEKKYKCNNYSFFEYGKYFHFSSGNFLFDFLEFIYFHFKNDNSICARGYRCVMRKLYQFCVVIIKLINPDHILRATHDCEHNIPVYLPPSQCTSQEILEFDREKTKSFLYFSGWLFRNPVGILKYRSEIKEYFLPKEQYIITARERIKKYRESYATVVGVHIRKGDYLYFANGLFYFSDEEIMIILRKYIDFFSLNVSNVVFLVFSDGDVNLDIFSGLNVFLERNEKSIGDLLELSMVDCIIGSNSTFGAFASYYGNIPQIVFQKNGIDWEYYKNKKEYFENKYITVVGY
ncbi:MAG: alpha-1,2-fucosyltransferase [Candidatus Paceibacterota bacterium]|jgi:hypothetical protein